MTASVIENTITFHIDKNLYGEDVVYKCFYWYTATFLVDIKNDTSQSYAVSVTIPAESINELIIEQTISKVSADLIDFKLRDIVTKETKTIRELIVAKAFAYYDTDEDPKTGVSDPVGFNPETI